jgi:hypothetical protein
MSFTLWLFFIAIVIVPMVIVYLSFLVKDKVKKSPVLSAKDKEELIKTLSLLRDQMANLGMSKVLDNKTSKYHKDMGAMVRYIWTEVVLLKSGVEEDL